jgi:hypothetical protein
LIITGVAYLTVETTHVYVPFIFDAKQAYRGKTVSYQRSGLLKASTQ